MRGFAALGFLVQKEKTKSPLTLALSPEAGEKGQYREEENNENNKPPHPGPLPRSGGEGTVQGRRE